MKTFPRIVAVILLLGAVALTSGRAAVAQEKPTPILATSYDNGVPTDNLAGVVLDLGVLYLVTYTQGVDVLVNVPDGQGGRLNTGTVTLRAGDQSFPATYAGPAPFFTGFQQVNVLIPRDQFPAGQTVYLRVCDTAGNCRNSTGATIKR